MVRIFQASVDKEILRLAIPNMISNVVIPLLGMVDTAIAGRIGADVDIAALALGTTVFNFIYWNCAFLRMGTGGLTAQAYGSGDRQACANILLRAVWLAGAMALLLVLFRRPVGTTAIAWLNGSAAVQQAATEYFFARIWAAPASIMLFALQGWFIGMQDSRTPMFVAIVSVVANALFSLLFVFRFDMGIAGIAWGTVVAQYIGLILSLVLWTIRYRRYAWLFRLDQSLHFAPLIRFLGVNRDIFLRTACVVAVYTFFTAASARFGDTILATNALLMQLFTLFSYLSDGFAYAGEALTGRFVGERNMADLRRYTGRLIFWAATIAVAYSMLYSVAWEPILRLFSPSPAVLDTARHFVGWVIAVPLVGGIPFMLDGMLIGATQTRLLRNTVFVATVGFFAAYFALAGVIGNNALWIAFLLFLLLRGILLYFGTNRLDALRIAGIAKHRAAER